MRDKIHGHEYLARRALGIDDADEMEMSLRKGEVVHVGGRNNLISFYWEVRSLQEKDGDYTRAVPRQVFVIERSSGWHADDHKISTYEDFRPALVEFNVLIDGMAKELAQRALGIGDDQ